MYEITNYTKAQAKKLGVDVKPSTNPKKKLDVFLNKKKEKERKVASIGAIGYSDYPHYIQSNGLVYANEKRKLYRIRHNKDLNKIGSGGFFASRLLW
jgi:hypothetical protein